jgi:long-subunit fatty acid transport protein
VTQDAYSGGFHFASIHANTPGEISLTLTGGPLGVWALEISGDLTNWSSFTSLTNATGRVDLLTPVAESNRFYRAVLP